MQQAHGDQQLLHEKQYGGGDGGTGGGDGGGGSQTSDQKNKTTGSTKQLETTTSEAGSQSNKHGRSENDRGGHDDEENNDVGDLTQKDGEENVDKQNKKGEQKVKKKEEKGSDKQKKTGHKVKKEEEQEADKQKKTGQKVKKEEEKETDKQKKTEQKVKSKNTDKPGQNERQHRDKHSPDRKKSNPKKTDGNSKQNRERKPATPQTHRNTSQKNQTSDSDSGHSGRENDDGHSRTRSHELEKLSETEQSEADSARNEQSERYEPSQKDKKKSHLDEDSLQMFLSTDNLQDEGHYRAGGGDRPWLDPHQVSDETKRKQEQIIRRILEEFDLEETMTKYRNSNVVVCRREGKSLADFRFRSEMIRMMGSEEIRLNDQEWSRKFQRKMVEDYERLLDEQENNLAQAERQRLHRLRVEGVVPDAETAGSPEGSGSDVWVFKAQHSPPSLKKSRGRRPTGYGEKGYVKNKPIFADEGSDKWERTLHSQRQEKIYSPPEDVQTQVAHLNREERREGKEPEAEREAGSEEGSAEGEEEEKDYMLEFLSRRRQTATEIVRRERVAEQRKKRYQHLPPEVARLYYEETVTGLYRLAAELLSPESTPAPRDTVKGVKMAQS